MTFSYFIYILGALTLSALVASGTFRIADKLEGRA